MAENKVNPLFNIHEKYREVIIINPYRFSDPDAVAQAARIIADGGTVIDFAFMNLVISTMKSMGAYSSCKLLTDANFGVKKDPSTGAVSKLYDISGNNNDAVQATGANQPIWSLVNGRGVITYDGVNDYFDFGTTKLDMAGGLLTIMSSCNTSETPTVNNIILSRAGTLTGKQYLGLLTPARKIYGAIFNGINGVATAVGTTVIPLNQIFKFAYSYDGNYGKVYYNGLLDGTSSLYSGVVSSATNNAYIGTRDGSESAYGNMWKGQINSSTIFNITLSQSQITQLTNLGL